MNVKKNLPILLMDLPVMVRFLRSVALAKAMSDTTRLEWTSYNDSTALNIAYTVFFWKEKPGFVEVQTASHFELMRRTDSLMRQFWASALLRLQHGPAAFAQFLGSMDRTRSICQSNVQEQFSQAGSINDEVIRLTSSSIRDLAKIKLAADLIVKLSPVVAVSLPYSIITTFIKEMHQASSAKVVAFKVASEPGKEGLKKLAERGSEGLAREAVGFAQDLMNAKVDIKRLNDLLIRRSATTKSIVKNTSRLEEAGTAAAAARSSMGLAKAGSYALKGVAWGFVALDVWESWSDYREAVQGDAE